MTNADKILAYTKKHYVNENKLIERSMVNYYHSRLKGDKTDLEFIHQQKIFDGVIDLFEMMSEKLSVELGIDSDEVFQHLKNIHIQT